MTPLLVLPPLVPPPVVPPPRLPPLQMLSVLLSSPDSRLPTVPDPPVWRGRGEIGRGEEREERERGKRGMKKWKRGRGGEERRK